VSGLDGPRGRGEGQPRRPSSSSGDTLPGCVSVPCLLGSAVLSGIFVIGVWVAINGVIEWGMTRLMRNLGVIGFAGFLSLALAGCGFAIMVTGQWQPGDSLARKVGCVGSVAILALAGLALLTYALLQPPATPGF
jgi:hypothetical protein